MGVNACRKGRDKLLLETRSHEDRAVLSAALKERGFKVRSPIKPWRPILLRISRVDRTITGELLKKAVWKQNSFLKDLLTLEEMEDGFIPSFMKGRRDLEDVTWVIKVSPKVRELLVDARYLNIGYARCEVSDFIDVNRCFKCQAYGHSSIRCRDAQDTCAKCSGPHRTNLCTSVIEKCINCQRAGQDANHAATDKACPAYLWALKKYVRQIDVNSAMEEASNLAEITS